MLLQHMTTREPDASMLECAIVSVNVVLNGFPEHCEKTPEGWGIFHDYRESEPGYVPETPATMESDSESGSESGSEAQPV